MAYTAVGVAIIAIATLFSLFLLKRNAKEHPKPVKIILFGVYFWGLVFLQLLIASIVYEFIVPK
ncbi:MAG: hypothetical protein FJ190_08345 [Gammaproteobacteria bacterium]|nr:hypothetical protein [Gammaproteobacteria bacterium]